MLQDCPLTSIQTWNLCFGIRIFQDGSRYVGEFLKGEFNGQGISYNVNPVKVSQSGYWVSGVLKTKIDLRLEDYPFNGVRNKKNDNLNLPQNEELLKERQLRTELEEKIKLLELNMGKEKEAQNSRNSAFDVFKHKCTELGFTPATEGHGKCVLQLSK